MLEMTQSQHLTDADTQLETVLAVRLRSYG